MKIALILCFIFSTASFAADLELTCGEKNVTINEGSLRMKIQYTEDRVDKTLDGYASKSGIKSSTGKSETYVSPSGYILKKETKGSGLGEPQYSLVLSSESTPCEIPF
jgi:hypothetical protein